MKIQDLERITGMERATIRFYERQGMITPQRMENGYRDYSEQNADELLKIKLLRQLDFTLDQIKEIQTGKLELSQAVSTQIACLKNKADIALRSSEICHMLAENRISYSTLDAPLYLNLLSNSERKEKFSDAVQPEIHPIRRFVARYLDWRIVELLCCWTAFCLLRIRPVIQLYSVLVTAAAIFAGIYLEAVLVYLTGTTPGKWIMGIRLESIGGRKVSWDASLWRAKLVTQEGLGFRIPVWREIRHYLSYKAYTEGKSLSWEDDTELQYKPLNWYRKICLGILAILLCVSIIGISLDISYYPTHRSDQLTMAQYITNYNGYAREGSTLSSAHQNETMTEKGQFDILPSIKADYIRQNPTYVCNEAGYVQQIQFTGKLEYDQTVMGHMILAAAAARKDADFWDIASLKAGTTINQEIRSPIYYGRSEGTFIVADIEVHWENDLQTGLTAITIMME